ncbi:putative disease resistance RPP13-like protein 1 [Lactuca sativa]|uniref:putative disease resistance RPP13-like protein 1 n=1 Tax=Lactuca sativa TaxID=4236 RepID=UPI0022AEE4AB|nr:putative disease resistance RPP13-like protein 1 [Lactuca sativa]
MAEIVVSAVITVLCEKLISGDIKLARSEGIDSQLNKWKKNLPMIQAVLADATEKQIKERAVQLWVNDLHHLAYDIDDVLDDLATEALRRKLNQETQASTSTSKVLKLVPKCCTNFSPRNIMYGQQMSSKLEKITIKLRDLVDQKNDLGLNVNVERSNITERRLEQTSLVDESKIMGREGDKEKLLGKLLGNEGCDQNVSVVSIVGMGGIGKTTLAKVLYNEQKVKDHFEVRAWVCVSEECDVFKISKAIFQAVTGQNKDFANLDLLHVALKEELSKKRFLLVLDDVWNEDDSKWEQIQSPLLVGAPRSRIIVTTRSTRVASVMDSQQTYPLGVLSNEDALSLFAQHALGEKNFDKHPTLKLFGEGMVQKCGRLPLALTALGRVLKGNRNGDKWEELLKSEIWDIDDGNKILPALKLSYYHLPPHLKQLFAYCSLIPKDYEFDKNKLVLLWAAEGFLSQSKGNKSMENLGHEYFEELKSRSFFQQSTYDDLEYTMHDLMNDLATSVAGEFSFRLDGEVDVSDMNETSDKFRHLSLVGQGSGSYRKFIELQRAKYLRTFLVMSDGWEDGSLDKVLLELQFLRVLSVVGLDDMYGDSEIIRKVPESIGNLKHLRYLNFSYTGITCLPEEVSELYNLQTLLVHDCFELSSLPKNFAKLINLRHLDISNTPKLNKMPLGIGGLMSLQTLTKVIIEEGNGFKISDLKGLSDLQGRLSIKGLDTVKNPIEAKVANLHQKKGLDVLEMEWSDVFDDSRNKMIEYEVLKELRPHPKLKKLKIFNNNGMGFPTWVGDPSFDQLTKLTLRGCRSTHLPTLGCLGCLKKLIVESMNEVQTVGFEFLAPANSNPCIAFPSLQVLKFDDMKGWQRWSINSGDGHGAPRSFPCLHEIRIANCSELAEVSIGLIPSLRVLYIEECSEAVLRSMVGLSSSLVELKMLNVKGLTQLHGEYLMHLRPLEHLYIENCDELRYLWERESEACKSLVSLQKLEVTNCKNLVSSAEKEANIGISMESLKSVKFYNCETLDSYNCPNSVENLMIGDCDSVTSLTFSAVQEHPSPLTELIVGDCDNIQLQPKPIPAKDFSLSRLTYLKISYCKNLKSFPHQHFQSFASLEELEIHQCPSMDYSFPCGVWPPNLTKLTIGGLNKPMSEWGPQSFPTSLVDLCLFGKNSGVVSFAVADDVRNTCTTPSSSSTFLLPPSLVSLALFGFMDVESFSEVLQHLPSLKRLEIYNCPKLGDLKTIYNPSNVTIGVWK